MRRISQPQKILITVFIHNYSDRALRRLARHTIPAHNMTTELKYIMYLF